MPVKRSDGGARAASYLDRVHAAIHNIDPDAIAKAAEVLIRARSTSALVLVAGNGGSASTASHMATDLGVGSHKQGVGLRAICISENSSVLTATANDISFTRVFAEQIELLASSGDVVVLISASGNSPNILEAHSSAVKMGASVIALTGFDGGTLRELASICVHVPTAGGDYGPVEDVHLMINHILTEIIRQEPLGGQEA